MKNSKTIKQFILALSIVCSSTSQLWADSWKEITYADPTIFVEEGKYYLTGTRGREPFGFALLESTDLKHWSVANGDTLQLILRKGDHVFGERGFWAPQYFKDEDTYYFTYTANEHTAIASSKSVFGPFLQEEIKPIDGSAKNIDPFLFKDDDGKYYLYHVRFNKGNYLWVAEFDMVKRSIKPETLKQCLDCTEPWEKTPNYKSAPIMEGPTVKKWDGVYYLFYSANHFMNIDYSVGYATSTSPFGPWKKNTNNPIIHRSLVGENGSGHGDVFKGLDGRYYYVYHVHSSDSTVQPRKTRIVPLIMKKENGIYHITIDRKHIIKPVWK
ncbi:family 43 glycosylhydrolase [Bacteroidaceae bacterium HV4-6-C5C]|nr:family 43 glycosylhydrolase [Bacteroidaceae bacterium HV4-6-C5C]